MVGTELVKAQTPDGDAVFVTVVDLDGSAKQSQGEQKVAAGLPSLADALTGVDNFTSGLRTALKKVSPDKTTVEISIGFAMEAGKLTALFVDGKAEGSVTITMEWGKD
jgi:hypothetical protein